MTDLKVDTITSDHQVLEEIIAEEPYEKVVLRMILETLGLEIASWLNDRTPEISNMLDAILAGGTFETGSGTPENGVAIRIEIKGDLMNSVHVHDGPLKRREE